MTGSLERVFVWSGGGMFAASLVFCTYSYVVVWSVPLREPLLGDFRIESGLPAALFDGALVTLFAAHHSVFARERVKRWLARTIPERLLRSVYVWTASLLLIAVTALWQPIGADVYRVSGWQAVIPAGTQLLGVWLGWRALRAIDALELAGVRRRPVEDLNTIGPYRVVRHPLYSGWLLVVFASGHMTGDRLAFAVFTALYIVIAIPWEERSLITTYGAKYEQYRERVRSRIIPHVY